MSRERLRIAWVEEWMSTFGREVLPYLAERHDVYYVTAGQELPPAEFQGVVRGKLWRHINLAGFELSRHVNQLHRRGLIDLAVVWASVGFGIRGVPFVAVEGTSVYAEILMFAAEVPVWQRARFLRGLLHYAVPEMLCDRRAVRVVTCSEFLKRDVVRLHHLPEDRVRVIHYGSEPAHLALYDGKEASVPPRLLYVGRLHFRKGIAAVLEEFVRRRDIDAEFWIAGEGPDRPRMESAAAGDARVKLLGSVGRGRLESLLVDTSVFVFPTLYEGFGLSITEAMSSGHACVCYDIPVVREVLGDTGVLVPMGDVRACVDAVARLVKSPQTIAELSARAHERARRFSWDEARSSMDAVLREAAGERLG